MIYDPSWIAIILFTFFVLFVLGLSFYLGNKTKSASSYFAAGGTIHWGVNGIAFAGDYLSAASFLGICGMIAVAGYDGFLYSIGYLAGWVVALFLVAEPMKRLGKFTFTDALDFGMNSKAIQLMAAISTLIVSMFYLIPQMVGAGALVTPLLGLPHWAGVVMVGVIVTFIVATAGMASTTYVQFMKGGLLLIFSTILTIYILNNGLNLKPSEDYHNFKYLSAVIEDGNVKKIQDNENYSVLLKVTEGEKDFIKLVDKAGVSTWWLLKEDSQLEELLFITNLENGSTLYNGVDKEQRKFYQVGHLSKIIVDGKEVDKTGALDPFEYLSTIEASEIVRFTKATFMDGANKVNV